MDESMKKIRKSNGHGIKSGRRTSRNADPASQSAPGNTRDISPVSPPATWDYEADIAIVGGGGAGLSAAARALDNGRTVIVIEKMPTTGGLSQHSGAASAFNTKVGTRTGGSVWDEAARKQALDRGLANSGYTVDPELLAMQVDRAHEIFDWTEKKGWIHWTTLSIPGIPDQGVTRVVVKDFDGNFSRVGMDLFNAGGAEYLMGMKPFIDWLAKFVSDKGGRILPGTPAKALVRDGNRIIGVQAHDADGKTIYIKGTIAVILAGGGFTNNREMVKKYLARAYEGCGSTWCPPLDTGEVIRMAFGAGADIAGEGAFMAFYGGIPYWDTKYTGRDKPGPWFQYLRSGATQFARQPWLTLNKTCEQFMPWAVSQDYTQAAAAVMAQPGHAAYRIVDADYATQVWKLMPVFDQRPSLPTDRHPKDLNGVDLFESVPDLATITDQNWVDGVEKSIGLGGIQSADSIDALAKELGLDPTRLTAAVDAWNAQCASGRPDAWGRPAEFQIPIVKAPFYGVKFAGLMGLSLCGPRVNANLQVLDKNGSVIPGLFAAGLSAGGLNGEYQMQTPVGSGIGTALTTGFVAGDNASRTTPSYVPGPFR